MFVEDPQQDTLYRGMNPDFVRRARENNKKRDAARREREERDRQNLLANERRERAEKSARLAGAYIPPYELVYAPVRYQPYAPKNRISIKTILAEVARKHGYRPADIRGGRKSRSLVWARHETFWRCKNERPDMSLPQIGRALNRDHSSILHGIRRHEQRMKTA